MTQTVRHVAVVDIGKTNAKLALVDVNELREIDRRRMPNSVLREGVYPHYDVEALWDFILDGLAALQRRHSVDAISVTTHGATAALIDGQGKLALPVLDYEHEGPDSLVAEYDEARPDFAETGSPRLPIGLNLGTQLYWQARAFPEQFGRTAHILMYPQYWAWRLTGVAANEMTSLGCHTDLWAPARSDYSALVDRMGWRPLFAPMRRASESLGTILPEIAGRTGLSPSTPVLCGIHDSNASLLPHLLSRSPPFSVVSTGTWVVAMAVGGRTESLDAERDTLINVNAFGDPVPSARFMGGREYETVTAGLDEGWTDDDVAAVLSGGLFLLPSVQKGSGPFPERRSEWVAEGGIGAGGCRVAASFYLALMTATCLGLAGADGATIVEGPFSGNELFLRMLTAATGRHVIVTSEGATGTSTGAAMLATGSAAKFEDKVVAGPEAGWSAYARRWADLAGQSNH
jgi:sugar (pentulose or hexulose) kinase